jgi:hypothetical protein
VELLFNDLSLHGQFPDLATFRAAIVRLMVIRQIAHRFGRSLHCHRNVVQAPVTPTMTMPRAVQALTLEERRVLMQWFTQHGPFWEDARNHRPDDWLECSGSIVTDTAVGEAAWCCLNGIERTLVSVTPSNWLYSPVPIDWMSGTGEQKTIEVENYWSSAAIETVLQAAAPPLVSWGQLEALATAQCIQLTFSVGAFAPLIGHPFVLGAAHRLMFIFKTLNRFKSCFDSKGERTSEGHELYHNFFTGKKGEGGRGALFSDSSDDEKRKFETEMTFEHPEDASRPLFCPWHGKVQTPPLRVHFSSPVRADEPLYIMYVGPKITKR